MNFNAELLSLKNLEPTPEVLQKFCSAGGNDISIRVSNFRDCDELA